MFFKSLYADNKFTTPTPKSKNIYVFTEANSFADEASAKEPIFWNAKSSKLNKYNPYPTERKPERIVIKN